MGGRGREEDPADTTPCTPTTQTPKTFHGPHATLTPRQRRELLGGAGRTPRVDRPVPHRRDKGPDPVGVGQVTSQHESFNKALVTDGAGTRRPTPRTRRFELPLEPRTAGRRRTGPETLRPPWTRRRTGNLHLGRGAYRPGATTVDQNRPPTTPVSLGVSDDSGGGGRTESCVRAPPSAGPTAPEPRASLVTPTRPQSPSQMQPQPTPRSVRRPEPGTTGSPQGPPEKPVPPRLNTTEQAVG